MGNVISFPVHVRLEQPPRLGPGETAAILFFLGVRYERAGEGNRAQPRRGARSKASRRERLSS